MKRKKCRDCGKVKAVDKFPKGYKGNPHSYCRSCFNRRSSEYYKKLGEKISYSRHKRERQAIAKDWRNAFGLNKNIWSRTSKAIRIGVLKKYPFCDCCGGKFPIEKIEVHHLDDQNPLNVRMLCVGCHKAWHRKHGQSAKQL